PQESVFPRREQAHLHFLRAAREQHPLTAAAEIQLPLRVWLLAELPDAEDGETRVEGPGRRLVVETQFRQGIPGYLGEGFDINGRMGQRHGGLQAPPFQGRHIGEIWERCGWC